MICATIERIPPSVADAHRFAGLLGTSSGRTPRLVRSGDALLVHRAAAEPARAKPVPARWQVCFHGQFHNLAEIAATLGLVSPSPEVTYAAALERWGTTTDQRVIGHYCAIALHPDGARLRLARSPFDAPPLHFRIGASGIVASSVLRSLFWRDEARPSLELTTLGRRMLVDFSDPGIGWYQGSRRIALGSAVELDFAQAREVWRYDLFANPPVRMAKPTDYVAAARDLLDEGVARALAGARQPGVLVTGGLDSAQVAASAALQLSAARTVHGFTYGPEAVDPAAVAPGRYSEEFAAVAELGALHPNLALHRFTNAGQDFRHGQRELLRAMGCAPPSLPLAWPLHDIFARARALGCDVLLAGDFGNESFSNGAPWAAPEYLLRLRWGQLARVLRANPGDSRPIWRRFLALAALPLLPRGVWRLVRRLRWGSWPDALAATGLDRGWTERARLLEAARAGGFDPTLPPIRSRRDFWRRVMAEDGQDTAETVQGLAQLYGIERRDPTAYRPLVEFCFGLPTDLFRRDGIDRWLAREMARGRLPEAQRINPEQGAHDVDWHRRISRARPELLAELGRMEADSDIAAVVDLPGLRRLIVEFPERSSWHPSVRGPYLTALYRGIAAGRLIAYAKGRNDI